ncbi:hypothetical protein VTL71DRAFT_5030 [Oculimacula yallundae]|uniref:Uncharacterized protein n=1 Tax=Oculimacula yallundae TaxID=86028 RepID=A0ABR4C1G0_9HELO
MASHSRPNLPNLLRNSPRDFVTSNNGKYTGKVHPVKAYEFSIFSLFDVEQEQTKRAVTTKQLDEMERHTSLPYVNKTLDFKQEHSTWVFSSTSTVMSESSSEAGLDQDQVKEAPQGRGILLGFCYYPDQDNQDEYTVFGTLNIKGQLVPVMRHGCRAGDDLQLCHTNLNTMIDFSIITFERHLVCFNRDVGALTKYCRIYIRHVDQKVPLSSFVAVKQTKRAMATKRLGEIERHTSPLVIKDGQAYTRRVEDVIGPTPRTKLETQHSSSALTSTAMSRYILDQLIEEAAEELG